jgi:hypothetical protein
MNATDPDQRDNIRKRDRRRTPRAIARDQRQ